MSLDIKKLENVSEKPDGKITARCPACAKDGRDRKGDHLIIFPDKNFGCVKYEKDAEHRKVIQALAGDGKRQAHVPSKLTVHAFKIQESSTVLNLGNYPRFSKTVRRQWPPVGQQANEPNEGPIEEVPTIEAPPADHVSSCTELESGRFTNDISKFNVPQKQAVGDYPALPPNPMRDRL
jgi:hypothetical protein